jgi:NADPH-dependent glutamate synthase beta subunit-like oxidoreductase
MLLLKGGVTMEEFEFDKNKFIETAKQLGIEIEFGSDRPGMFIVDENGNEKEVTFEDIFPELKELEAFDEFDE